MSQPVSTVALLLLTLFVSASVIAEKENELIAAERFLTALEADWQGRAVLTPIGPRSYDIAFQRDDDGKITGSTGVNTVHYWAFYLQDNNLTIRFLSTFGGNRDPIYLYAQEWSKHGILFRAKKPELLSVRVLVSSEQLFIDVFHWDKPHVSIRLTANNRVID